MLGFEPGDFVTVATHGVQRARTVSVDDLDADYAMGLFDQVDTWIGAQPVKPGTPDKRTKASDVACVRVLYADLDFKSVSGGELRLAAMAIIDELSEILGTPAISIVDSGGGLHPRWKLAKPIEPGDASGVLSRWQATVQRVAAEHGAKADSVFDLPRVLRLPGTVNGKYDPPRPVSVASAADAVATVPTATVWSKLDQHPTKLKNAKKVAPRAEVDADLEIPAELPEPPKRPEPVDTLPERYVNSEIAKAKARLAKLAEDGWDGEPWHNTTRDVAFLLAKIGASPETTISTEEAEEIFLSAVPGDDTDEWDADVEKIWETALERAEDEMFKMIGHGDEIFADDAEAMFAGAQAASAPKPLDIDPDLDLSDLGAPAPPDAPLAPASVRYADLEIPLVPGFNGQAGLRTLPLPDPAPLALSNKLRVIGEDISDLHETEHDEYMHPHCPLCFPASWEGQLYRWTVRNPRGDSTQMHPPLGRTAPGEGYIDGLDLLAMPDSEMLVSGFIPTSAVGILAGRNGCGKTFLALDIAMHVLDPRKSTWSLADGLADEGFGEVNEHGGVLFFAGEGFRSVKSRVRAWLRHNGYDDDPAKAPRFIRNLDIRGEVPNFFTGGEDYDRMLDRVARTKPRLVIVDTLQKAANGADQNSASDMSLIHSRIARIKALVDGVTVIVIAHSTKDDTSVRGSSALEDDADFVLHARKTLGSAPNSLEVTKMRDSESPGPLDYYLAPVGSSVVVSSTRHVAAGSFVDETHKVEILTAFDVLHGLRGEMAELTTTEIVKQVKGLDQAEIFTIISRSLIGDQLVARVDAEGKKFQLTPKGRAWLESRDSAVFARSRGLS